MAALVGASFLAYVAAFPFVFAWVGPPAGALHFLPIALVGWCYGRTAGALAGLLSIPMTVATFGVADGSLFATLSAPLHFVTTGTAMFLGYVAGFRKEFVLLRSAGGVEARAPAILPRGRRFTMLLPWLGTAAIAAVVIITGSVAAASVVAYQEGRDLEYRYQEAIRVHAGIVYLDEVLTMSARMYASTGASSWKERYAAADEELLAHIARANHLALDEGYANEIANVADANDLLLDMEDQAFRLTDAGEGPAALLLLTSDEYTAQKAVYKSGNDAAAATAQGEMAAARRVAESRFEATIFTSLLLGGATLGATALMARESSRSAKARSQAEVRRERELSEFKTQLLNTASHELNTPIGALRMQAHLLRAMLEKGDLAAASSSLALVDRNALRLANLVADTLDVARIQSGKLEVRLANVSLADILNEVLEAFRPMAAKQKVDLVVDARHLPSVRADQARVVQVLNNLVSNAIKFTPAGGKVSLTVMSEDDRATIEVRDSGIGMRPDQIERLFKPFSRVHDQAGPTVSGTGLGLFISQGIVTQHGGRLTCASDGPNRGTTFGFDLPKALVGS